MSKKRGAALKTRVMSIIQVDHKASLESGAERGYDRSVVGGWAEDLEFNTYMIVKTLRAQDLGNWNEFPAESQKSQKDKNLCERMSYKIISAQQLEEMTWKLLSAGGRGEPSLPLYPGLRIF